MTRTVKVVLDVEEDPFVRGVRRADDAADGLDKAFKDVDKSAKGTGVTLGKTTDQIDKTGKAAKGAGKDLDEMRRHAAALDKQIDSTRLRVESLAKGFAHTGDKSLLKSLGAEKSHLSSLLSVRDILPDADDFKTGGMEAAKSFAAGLQGTLSTPVLGPAVMAGLVAVAVPAGLAAGSAAGAALGGALVGALGLGALGAGIAASMRNGAVKTEMAALRRDFLNLAGDVGDDFGDEVSDAIRIARADVKELGPELRAALAPAASYLAPLAAGFDGLIRNALPGLTQGIQDAKPVIDVIAAELPEIGASIGYLFETIGDNADEIASGVQLVLYVAEDLITVGADIISWLSEAYVTTLQWGIAITTIGSAMPFIGGTMHDLGVDLRGLLDTATGNELGPAMDEIAAAMDRAAGATRGHYAALVTLSNQMRAQTDPAFALLEAQNGLATAQKKAAKATKEHGANSEQAKAATRDLARQAIILQGAVGGLGDEFTGKLSPAMLATLEAAGLTKGQIKAVEKQMSDAKKAGEAYAKKYPASVTLTGVAQSKAGLRQLKAEAEAFAGRNYTATARLNYVRVGKPFSDISGGISGSTARGFAKGGIHKAIAMASGGVTPSAVYRASNPPLIKFAEPETRQEAYIPERGGNPVDKVNTLRTAASWMGMQVVPMAAGGVSSVAAWQSGRGSGSAPATVRVIVQDGAVRGLIRVEVDDQLGRVADAAVYDTAS